MGSKFSFFCSNLIKVPNLNPLTNSMPRNSFLIGNFHEVWAIKNTFEKKLSLRFFCICSLNLWDINEKFLGTNEIVRSTNNVQDWPADITQDLLGRSQFTKLQLVLWIFLFMNKKIGWFELSVISVSYGKSLRIMWKYLFNFHCPWNAQQARNKRSECTYVVCILQDQSCQRRVGNISDFKYPQNCSLAHRYYPNQTNQDDLSSQKSFEICTQQLWKTSVPHS